MGTCTSRAKRAGKGPREKGEWAPGTLRRRTRESRGGTEVEGVDDEVLSIVESSFVASNSRKTLGPGHAGGQIGYPGLHEGEFVLPTELLRSGVLTFLHASSLRQAGMTCVAWREASIYEYLWKAICLDHWVGKHVALLEGLKGYGDSCEASQGEGERTEGSPAAVAGPAGRESQRHRQLIERASGLHGGLEDVVAAMPIKAMKRRLEELGANPLRLGTCLEKGECVSLVMGSMLLSREGLLREGGQLPPWVSSLRGWRWSYYYAKADARRCWLTMDDLVRTPWTMTFPSDMTVLAPPLLVPSLTCEFHRDFSYTDEGFHQTGLDWHFEDSHRCVKVSSYPALEAERDPSWGWRLVNAYVVFKQQRRPT